MAARRRRRVLLRSVRVRTTVLATAVVTLALLVGAIGVILLARFSFEASIKRAAFSQADSIAALARDGLLPERLPRGGNVVAAQVVAGDEVVAASFGIEELPPLAPALRPRGRADVLDDELTRILEPLIGFRYDGATSVVSVGTTTPEGPATVIVASSLDTQNNVDVFLEVIFYGMPGLLGMVALVTWWVTGRALGPVERMRAEAERITVSDLHRRLPVPESTDEIQRLAETLNGLLARLEEATERQRRFISDASHELKSPLAAMRTMLDVAETNPEAVDWPTLLADLRFEDSRLELLVTDLLTLASADEGALQLDLQEADLDELVRSEAEAAGRPERVVHTSEVEAVRAIADQSRVRQLVRNLLDNALLHSDHEVWLSLRQRDGLAVLDVSDDGPGIPAEERERVFERFVRLDESRARDDGGTGLGLSVVRMIARAHGGSVELVESRRGGATFEVRLPIGGPARS